MQERIDVLPHHKSVDGLVKDASRDESIVVIENVDASIVLDKYNGAHSSNYKPMSAPSKGSF